MYLVITHLTRMQPGFICVAGIDPDSGRQIRPIVLVPLHSPATSFTKMAGLFKSPRAINLGPDYLRRPCARMGRPPHRPTKSQIPRSPHCQADSGFVLNAKPKRSLHRYLRAPRSGTTSAIILLLPLKTPAPHPSATSASSLRQNHRQPMGQTPRRPSTIPTRSPKSPSPTSVFGAATTKLLA